MSTPAARPGADRVLHLLAGPNGSGKSTLVAEVIEPETHLPFVNADVIAASTWPGEESAHAYEASAAATALRAELITAGRSFITETVFSHPSKLELTSQACAAGYRVELHVLLVPVELTVARVRQRVAMGGHQVPEVKIRERYTRLWRLVVQARGLADRTRFYNNTSAADPLRWVATFEHGVLIGDATWPSWAPAEITAPTG